MSSDEKVLDFPRVEVTSEENARRVMVEAFPSRCSWIGMLARLSRCTRRSGRFFAIP